MPVTMSMNKTSPPRSPTYMHPSKSMYKPPSPDPAEVLAAAKANELLNLRSMGIRAAQEKVKYTAKSPPGLSW